MLGLMALQGLQVGEVKRLKIEAVNLSKATIDVPSCRRSKPRRLKLEAEQIALFQYYLSSARSEILAGWKTDALFMSSKSRAAKGIQNVLMQLSYRLQSRYVFFERLEQLRASRIAVWVEEVGLRKAQVLAGHRHIGSTERYQRATLEALKKSVEKHHPLG